MAKFAKVFDVEPDGQVLFQVGRTEDSKAALLVTTVIEGAEVSSCFGFDDDSQNSFNKAYEALAVNATQEEADEFYRGMFSKFGNIAANDLKG